MTAGRIGGGGGTTVGKESLATGVRAGTARSQGRYLMCWPGHLPPDPQFWGRVLLQGPLQRYRQGPIPGAATPRYAETGGAPILSPRIGGRGAGDGIGAPAPGS